MPLNRDDPINQKKSGKSVNRHFETDYCIIIDKMIGYIWKDELSHSNKFIIPMLWKIFEVLSICDWLGQIGQFYFLMNCCKHDLLLIITHLHARLFIFIWPLYDNFVESATSVCVVIQWLWSVSTNPKWWTWHAEWTEV